ncbi:MAG TPA: hypothetical protein VKR43_16890, partial [Bryobacteraceae bacterium]|nr:hypothetical protein [Bryobacteraceae bacterium]
MHTHSHHPGHRHGVALPHDADGHAGNASRRDFLQRLLGGAMAGASVLELGFFRAAVARAQAPAAGGRL